MPKQREKESGGSCDRAGIPSLSALSRNQPIWNQAMVDRKQHHFTLLLAQRDASAPYSKWNAYPPQDVKVSTVIRIEVAPNREEFSFLSCCGC